MTTPEDPTGGQQPPPPPPPPGGGYGPPPPGYGPPQNSNTPMVLGIVGIVLALCCWPAGLACGIISYVQAGKQPGGNTVLGIVAIALSVVFGLISIISIATGNGFVYYKR